MSIDEEGVSGSRILFTKSSVLCAESKLSQTLASQVYIVALERILHVPTYYRCTSKTRKFAKKQLSGLDCFV